MSAEPRDNNETILSKNKFSDRNVTHAQYINRFSRREKDESFFDIKRIVTAQEGS